MYNYFIYTDKLDLHLLSVTGGDQYLCPQVFVP